MITNSRFVRLLAAGLLTLGVSAGAQAQYLNVFANVSASDSSHQVSEPVTAAQVIGWSTYYVVAYMQSVGDPESGAKLYTVSTTNLRQQSWPNQQEVPRPAGFDKSADPVLLTGTGSDGSPRMYLLGTTWNQTGCTGDNQITLWSSSNGGQSWQVQTGFAPNVAGQNVFDDKPAGLVSQYAPRAGTVYVAFTRNPMAPPNCSATGPNTMALYKYNTNGTVTQLNTGLVRSNITDPILYEDPSAGTLWLSYMDFNAPYSIRFLVSYDGGNSWADAGGAITDAGLLPPPAGNPASEVCDTGGRCVHGAIGMAGKFNPVNGSLTLAWAHRVDLSGGARVNQNQAQVVYTWGLPGRFFTPSLVTTNVAGHITFTPALDIGGNGNVMVTYYDAENPASINYRFHATEITPMGVRLGEPGNGGSDVVWDPLVTSSPTYEALGEYQGVFFHNGVFDAVTVYFKNFVADVYHLQIVP